MTQNNDKSTLEQVREALEHALAEHTEGIMFATVKYELQQALAILDTLQQQPAQEVVERVAGKICDVDAFWNAVPKHEAGGIARKIAKAAIVAMQDLNTSAPCVQKNA